MDRFIKLGSLEVSRFVSGSNPLSGYSHQSSQIDDEMKGYFTFEQMKKYLRDCEENGITAIVARIDKLISKLIQDYRSEGGSIKWIGQTAREYGSLKQNIREGIGAGVDSVFIHGGTTDQYFSEGREDELITLIEYAKKEGVPVGIASHKPQNLLAVQERNISVDYYLLCLYDLSGYMGRRDIPIDEKFDDEDRVKALKTLRELNRPCILYKVLGAGRKTLEDGLKDVGLYIRPIDGVMIGMFPKYIEDMVASNVVFFNRWMEALNEG